jgi:NADH:flavin oxidoreductase / NADH oxidase family
MVVQAVGMIVDPPQAEAIVADGHADCVAVARGFFDDPRWAWHAAATRRGCRLPAAVSARPPRTVARRNADAVPTGARTPLDSDPTRRDDGPQPVADLGSAANRIHDLARNPIAPNQVAAGRLCVQSAIIGRDRDDLGR